MKENRILEEKKLLIESMTKLVDHITDNRSQQLEIFHSLLRKDLQRIIGNIEDSNRQLRRVSIRFLCELMFENHRIASNFLEILEQPLLDGKLCLTELPKGTPQATIEMLEAIRRTRRPEGPVLAWAYRDGQIFHIFKHDRPEAWEKIDSEHALVGVYLTER
jgi:hypothetical protein